MDEKKFDVVAEFGVDVFNEETMQQRLPKNVFKALKKTMTEGKELDSSIADIVALGYREGRNSLHSLVPADDRHHRRETRQLHLSERRRHSYYGILGQGAYQGRA